MPLLAACDNEPHHYLNMHHSHNILAATGEVHSGTGEVVVVGVGTVQPAFGYRDACKLSNVGIASVAAKAQLALLLLSLLTPLRAYDPRYMKPSNCYRIY